MLLREGGAAMQPERTTAQAGTNSRNFMLGE